MIQHLSSTDLCPKNLILTQHYESPCGTLLLGALDERLCLCDWEGRSSAERNKRRLVRWLHTDFQEASSEVLEQTKAELNAYFAGNRRAFDLPLRTIGTPFQRAVWDALRTIPYGQTATYKDIAAQIGCPQGVRAVAQAIGSNALSIIIPCHRVIGSDHTLTGFAGGLNAKRFLLAHEGAWHPHTDGD